MNDVKVHYDYKYYYPRLDIPRKEPVVPIEQTKRSKTTMRTFVATRKNQDKLGRYNYVHCYSYIRNNGVGVWNVFCREGENI